MKKLFILCVTLLLLCTGCSKKIESVDANDDQLNAVIAAAETYLNSDEFKGYVDLFETTYGQDAKNPEVTVAFTFQHDDVEGFAYDLILFNIKADVAYDDHGQIVGYDSIQVIIDTKTKTAYDSLTYNDDESIVLRTFLNAYYLKDFKKKINNSYLYRANNTILKTYPKYGYKFDEI